LVKLRLFSSGLRRNSSHGLIRQSVRNVAIIKIIWKGAGWLHQRTRTESSMLSELKTSGANLATYTRDSQGTTIPRNFLKHELVDAENGRMHSQL